MHPAMLSVCRLLIASGCLAALAAVARGQEDVKRDAFLERTDDFEFRFNSDRELTAVFSKGHASPTIVGSQRIRSIAVSREDLRSLAARASLKSLSLAYCDVAEEDSVELRSAPSIEFLGFVGTKLTAGTLQSLGSLKTLKKIDLRNTPLEIERLGKQTGAVVISGSTSETYAAQIVRDLRRSQNEARDPDRAKHQAQATGWYFSGRTTDDAALDSLTVGPNVERLSFADTAVSPQRIKTQLDSAPQLKAILLAEQQVDVELARSIASLKQLRYLDLSRCTLDDAAIAELGRSRSLQYLKVTSKQLTDGCCRTLAEIPTLVELSLQAEATDKGLNAFAGHKMLLQLNCVSETFTSEKAEALERTLIGGRVVVRLNLARPE